MDSIDEIKMLRECLEVDLNTGSLKWAKKTGKKVVIGREVGSMDELGYIKFQVNQRRYQAHRVLFALAYGRWPVEIDHINGNPSDNRISNLREATRSQNNMNRRLQHNNTSGAKGVYFVPRLGKWHARIKVSGKFISLRYHQTLESAARAYADAACKYHGEFAREERI